MKSVILVSVIIRVEEEYEMKKTLAICLILTIVFSLSACGSSGGKDSGQDSNIKIKEKPAEEQQPEKEDKGKENFPSGDGVYMNFSINPSTDFFYMDTDLFGISYDEFTATLSDFALTPIEEWQWWGTGSEIVFAANEKDTFGCLFQDRKLVAVYRDSADDEQGEKYTTAVECFGEPSSETPHWSGSTEYTWDMGAYKYQQHIEIYSEGDGHYRQQYVSDSFVK